MSRSYETSPSRASSTSLPARSTLGSRSSSAIAAGSSFSAATNKLVLRIQFPASSAKLAAVFQFESDLEVHKAIDIISQKYDGDSSAEPFGLFIGWDDPEMSGTWLELSARLCHYPLTPKTPIFFRNKKRTLQVTDLDGGSRKKVIICETESVSTITSIVGKRYGIEDASEFSLQVQRKGSLHWMNPQQSLPEQRVTETQSVVLRKKFFVTDMMVTVNHPALLHLLFLEGRYCIVSGIYPSALEQAVQFAALQMQITYGNYDPLSHVAGFLNLVEFLPKRYRTTPFIEEDVYREHRKVKDYDELEAKNRYIRKCFKLPAYGATFRLAIDKTSDNDCENEILFGVNCDALLCLHRKSKDILGRHLLVEVVGVFVEGKCLTLRFKGRNREFVFESEADAIVLRDLVVGYKGFQKMRRKERFAHAQLQKQSGSQLSPQMAPLRLVGSQQRLKALHLMSSSLPSSPSTSDSPIETGCR